MIRCTKCSAVLPDELYNSPELKPCPVCGSFLKVDAFPSLYRTTPEGNSGELITMDDEAGCFYHPKKRAVTTCANCGRFLCSLCDVDFNYQHLCFSCIEISEKKGKFDKLEKRRIRYDNLALGMAVLPVMVWFITIITAPVTMFLVIRYWKKPSGLLKTGRIRMVIAFFLAGGQVAAWLILFSIVLLRYL